MLLGLSEHFSGSTRCFIFCHFFGGGCLFNLIHCLPCSLFPFVVQSALRHFSKGKLQILQTGESAVLPLPKPVMLMAGKGLRVCCKLKARVEALSCTAGEALSFAQVGKKLSLVSSLVGGSQQKSAQISCHWQVSSWWQPGGCIRPDLVSTVSKASWIPWGPWSSSPSAVLSWSSCSETRKHSTLFTTGTASGSLGFLLLHHSAILSTSSQKLVPTS